MHYSIQDFFNFLAVDLYSAMIRVHDSNNSEEACADYFKAKKNWDCFQQVHGKMLANMICGHEFNQFIMTPRYETFEDCLQCSRSFSQRIRFSRRPIIKPKIDRSKTMSILDVMNILSRNLEFAQDLLDFVSVQSIDEQFIASIKLKAAQQRWIDFWKIHGDIIGNSNWESNFVKLMTSRYNNVEECFQ